MGMKFHNRYHFSVHWVHVSRIKCLYILQIEVQNLKDKLHQFKKRSKESEMDIQKTNESITLIEDKTKTLEEKLRNSEMACEDWQDKFKESQETIYQHSTELKRIQTEKSSMEA